MSSVETLRAWVRPLNAEELLALVGPSLSARERAAPEAWLCPCFDRGRLRDERAGVLLRDGRRLTLLARDRGSTRRCALSLDDVHTVEWGTALLHSWFRLEAAGADGPVTLRVDFNTVTEGLFRPIVADWLGALHAGDGGELERERAWFDPLLTVDYRFMNAGRDLLVRGARVERVAHQPRLLRGRLRLLRRVAVPGAVAVLTGRALAIAVEGDEGQTSYATISTWMRRDRIVAVERERLPGQDEVARVRVRMPGGVGRTVRHGGSNEALPALCGAAAPRSDALKLTA